MADFNALQAIINAYIKRNGVQAITGQILNGVLTGMVNALGKGYTVAGAASPTTDPGTMTGPLAYIAYTAGTYTHFDNIVVEQGEVSMLIYNEAEWHKEVLFSLAAQATVDDNIGVPSVGVSFVDGILTFDFRNMKGEPGENGQDGDPAGFGTISASIAGGVGTPGVSVQSSGPDTAKNIAFQFTNLKGETGVTSCVVTVDNTTGNPSCAVSLVGQELHLDFSGLKGAQGDTGSSVDYPFTIVNNLTTDDPTQALSAAMGVQLESEVSQLEAEVGQLYYNEGKKITFESGAVNYLNGNNTNDPKSIRCGQIPISFDADITVTSPRTLYVGYVIKYLNGVYAGYSAMGGIDAKKFTYHIVKDNTFNSIRIRYNVRSTEDDWTASEIAGTSATLYTEDAVGITIDSIVTRLEEIATLDKTFPIWSNRYANLSGLSVGTKWSPAFTSNGSYGCYVLRCSPGDKFNVATFVTTSAAKAYAFLKEDLTCISVQQSAFVGVLIAPALSAYLVVNTRTTSDDKYFVKKFFGKLCTGEEIRKMPYYFDIFQVFDQNINYTNGNPIANDGTAVMTGLINITNNVVLKLSTPQTKNINLYVIRYLDGVFVDYFLKGPNESNNPIFIEKESTFNEVVVRLSINDAIWLSDEIKDTYISVYPDKQFRDLYGDIVDYRHYQIGNYDNEFQFDKVMAMMLKAGLFGIYPNFNVPTEGAFLSTDVDYVGVRTSPVTDEQLTKANVPYLYINGEKRGTIVLYDTDGTPFIYDKNGNKITLN